MYNLEQLLNELRPAAARNDYVAVQEAVRHAVLEGHLARDAGKTELLHSEPGLTLVHTVVGRGFVSPPHDHRTWAVIGVYSGQEDNTFYRLIGATRQIEAANGRSLRAGQTLTLGPEGIHHIANPRQEKLIALHVYGRNIFEIERSAWELATNRERPFITKLGDGGIAEQR